MKHLKSFNEDVDHPGMQEVEPGRWVPKGTRYQDVNPSFYKLSTRDILDIVHSFSGANIPIEAIEEEMGKYNNKKI